MTADAESPRSPLYDAADEAAYGTLWLALDEMKRKAGIQDVSIGDAVIVNAQWGSHAATFAAAITHFYDADETSFTVGLSLPTFWGAPLVGLQHQSGKGWVLGISTSRGREFIKVNRLEFRQKV